MSNISNQQCAVALTIGFLNVVTTCFGGGISFQGLGDLPGGAFSSGARGVSLDGSTVVGQGRTDTRYEAFSWRVDTGMVGLGGGNESEAIAANADGSYIAGLNTSGWRACRWLPDRSIQHLGDLPGGGESSVASSISADGSVVVGWGQSANGTEAFRWTAETGMVGLGDLPGRTFFSLAAGISMDGSTIAGNSEAEFGNQAFRWTAQTGLVGLPDLPGGEIYSQAHGISPDGSVIVGISSGAIETIGVYWTTDGSIVPLGLMPGGTWTRPKDASLNGEIIVGLGRLPGRDAAMIWDAENGVRNLESVLATDYGLDLTGWQLTAANGISADGRVIAGTGVNPQGHAEGWVAIIPEPATAIAIGVVGAIWIRRRR